jgi:DNA-binding transcriptional regulator GbsR (MarR family)
MKKEIKVMQDKNLSATSKLIMIYFIIENINSIDISIDELSNIFACSRKTIINSMKELEEEKYIKKIKRGQGKNNIYIVKGEE